MNNDWYKDFFDGLSVELWQQVLPDEVSAQDVKFVEEQLRLSSGQHVLDIGCGHGRHAVLLAAAGYRVTGADISSQCLALAQQAAQSRNVDVRWIQEDLYDQPNLPRCDGIIWMGNGLGYGDAQHTQALLTQLAEVVREGGRMLIDSGAIAESILPHFEETGEYEFGGIQMSSRREYQPMLGCMDIEYTFRRADVVQVRGCRQWVFMLAQFRHMLESAGWHLVHVFSDVEGVPYHLGGRYARIIAEKA